MRSRNGRGRSRPELGLSRGRSEGAERRGGGGGRGGPHRRRLS
jgi:hypothetical protein